MTEGTKDGRSDSDQYYQGPYIAAREVGVEGWQPWVWVASGIRPPDKVFATPGPIVTNQPQALLTAAVDEASVDRFVDELRSELWENEPDVWAGGDEELGRHAENESSDDFASDGPTETVEIRVLGPIEVVGWSRPPERSVVTELACYLALHRGRSIPGEELRAAIWPDIATEASAKTLRTYMSLLRKALGAHHVPVGSASGYRIGDGVESDWARFQMLREDGSVEGCGRRSNWCVAGPSPAYRLTRSGGSSRSYLSPRWKWPSPR